MDWELYAWLKRGSRRRAVLTLLYESEKALTANEVKNKMKISLSQSSFSLNELLDKKLIVCLNPSDKIGKLYKITGLGEELINEI